MKGFRTASVEQPIRPPKTISIADAKAQFSSLITRVHSKRLPITILRRGVPVAQIMPITSSKIETGYGWMKGSVQEIGDIVGPTGVEWNPADA